MNNASGDIQQGNRYNTMGRTRAMPSEISDQNILHPIHVNAIDSEVEDISFITTDVLMNTSF